MAEWSDNSVYPGTQVLRNRLNIQDARELAQAENRSVRNGTRSLKLTDRELLTPAAIGKVHGELFGPVYEWAGKHRTVDISKGGTHFLPASRIALGLEQVSRQLQAHAPLTDLKALKAEATKSPETAAGKLAAKLAGPVAELNYVHPFREGNGRATRAYMDQIAARAGLKLDTQRIDRAAWIQASIDSTINPANTRGIEFQLRGALVPREQQRQAQQARIPTRSRTRGTSRGDAGQER